MTRAVAPLPDGRTWNGHDFVHTIDDSAATLPGDLPRGFVSGCHCPACKGWLDRPSEHVNLYPGENGVWMARYSGPFGQRMKAVLGTTDAPTPYTTEVPFDVVRAQILATHKPSPGVHFNVFCQHRRTWSKAGVGVVHCKDCGQTW